VFFDLSERQVPAETFKGRRFDLNGLPVLVGSGPTNEIGLQAGRSLILGEGFSLEGRTSLSRTFVPGAELTSGFGTSAVTASPTARFQQGGWDIAVFPELSMPGLVSDGMTSYVLGGSVARQTGDGWTVSTSSRFQRTSMSAAEPGALAKGDFGITHLPLFGAQLDLGYAYDWARPNDGAATLAQGPSVALDLGLMDALNCRISYRYGFAGEGLDAAPGFASLGPASQDLAVGWDWDLAAEGMRSTTLSANIAYHQDFFATSGRGDGSGGINFATSF